MADKSFLRDPHVTDYSAEPPQAQLDGVIRAVNAHYTDMPIEPWDVVNAWPLEQQIGAYRHGVLKYTMRMGRKDARLQEARKALHYAQKLVETLEKQP